MFERFTERARRVLFFARLEASEFGSLSIEPEHVLLGLIREGRGLTTRLLTRSGVPVHVIKQEVQNRLLFKEKVSTSVEIPFSEPAKRIVEYAVEESDRLHDRHVATEHLLLGILREERSAVATILREKGVRLDDIRDEIAALRKQSPSPDVRLAWGTDQERPHLHAAVEQWHEQRRLGLQFRENAYWLPAAGEELDGPFCSICWDFDQRLVRKLTDVNGALYCEYCTKYRSREGR